MAGLELHPITCSCEELAWYEYYVVVGFEAVGHRVVPTELTYVSDPELAADLVVENVPELVAIAVYRVTPDTIGADLGGLKLIEFTGRLPRRWRTPSSEELFGTFQH